MSFSSFEKLILEIPKLSPPKLDIKNYLAHTPGKKNHKLSEPLTEHIDLVNNTAIKLIKVQNLEPLIEGLIYDLCCQIKFSDKKLAGDFLKEVFISTIVFHDYGKINENFQVDKMQNPLFKSKTSSIGSQHSILSAYLFLNHYLKTMSRVPMMDSYQNEIAGIICAFSDSILRHHSSVIDIKEINNPDLSIELESYLNFIGLNSPFEHFNQIIESKIDFQEGIYLDNSFNNFPLYTLIKLNFSLLTAADYLATLSYHNNISLAKSDDKKWWGILSDQRKMELFDKFLDSAPYNKQALTKPEKLTKKSIETYKKRPQKNMNALRSIILGEVIQNLRKQNQEKLFYLKAPTGAGKTNISLAASIELLSKDKTLNKVFYVFPFTTLITQTYKSIIETLGLKTDELVQLHSKSEWNKRNQEEKSDGLYQADWENHIENLFVHYPFTLLSHIKFFDVLKGNKKETNYLLHRFSNSVVIIDELQSYNPKFWEHINYFITHYANALNMRFVLMSATLPEIGKLTLDPKQKWIDLISNPQQYFQNKNFSGRVIFDYSLIEENENIDLNILTAFIADKGNQYATENSGSVKVIVEFIKKQTASDFYLKVTEDESYNDYTVLILSGTILNPRREEIVNNLQCENWLANNPKVLIISTQVVEAGVNIDMDLGFKDTSLIDSDEQLAGRVNRNAKKDNSKVYLFNLDKEDNIYRGDPRIEFQRTEINLAEHKQILEKKEFSRLYDKIINKHIKNREQLFRDFSTYLKHLQTLRFKSVHEEFKLIEDSSGSVFIPLDLPKKAFTTNEIKLLLEMGVISGNEDVVSGAILFDRYKEIVLNRTNIFIVDRDNMVKFQSLISKYTISLFRSAIDQIEFIEKKESGDQEPYQFGFLYFSSYKKYYDYEEGLNLPKEENLNQNTALAF